MSKLKWVGLFVFLLTIALPGLAQESEFETVLLPVSTPEIAGAFATRWVTEHFVRNDGPTPVNISRDDCGGPACVFTVDAESTMRLVPSQRRYLLWLAVERAKSKQVYFSTIVRDVSKNIEPWGTEIPAARESEFRPGRVQLLNVPTDPAFRLNLRIFTIPAPQVGEIVIALRIFDLDSELSDLTPGSRKLLAEQSYTMRNTPIEQGVDYLEILDLSGQFPGIREAQRLRVEIERTGGGEASFWALLTATNNQTQHVTIFTPE